MFNAIKELGKAAFKVVANAPIGGIIKVGLLIGSAVFAAWVLIVRAKKMHNAANGEKNEYYSPVDEILGKKKYATSTEDFEDMDPLAQEICKKLNKMGKRKKRKGVKVNRKKIRKDIFDDDFASSKSKKGEHVRTVSLFDDPLDDEPDIDDLSHRHPCSKKGGMDAATEMLIEDEIRKMRAERKAEKYRKQRHEKAAAAKGLKGRPIDKKHYDEINQALDMWRTFGESRKDVIKARLDEIARDLGLNSMEDLADDDVTDEVRAAHPNLF